MNSGDTDVSNLHVCVNTPANLKLITFVKEKDMNDLGRSTLHALHDEIVIIRSLKIHDLEELSLHLVLEWSLAQLTLESLPEEAADKVAIIDKFLTVHPLSQAVNVDVLHGP